MTDFILRRIAWDFPEKIIWCSYVDEIFSSELQLHSATQRHSIVNNGINNLISNQREFKINHNYIIPKNIFIQRKQSFSFACCKIKPFVFLNSKAQIIAHSPWHYYKILQSFVYISSSVFFILWGWFHVPCNFVLVHKLSIQVMATLMKCNLQLFPWLWRSCCNGRYTLKLEVKNNSRFLTFLFW